MNIEMILELIRDNPNLSKEEFYKTLKPKLDKFFPELKVRGVYYNFYINRSV